MNKIAQQSTSHSMIQNVVLFTLLGGIAYFFWVSKDWKEDEEEFA